MQCFTFSNIAFTISAPARNQWFIITSLDAAFMILALKTTFLTKMFLLSLWVRLSIRWTVDLGNELVPPQDFLSEWLKWGLNDVTIDTMRSTFERVSLPIAIVGVQNRERHNFLKVTFSFEWKRFLSFVWKEIDVSKRNGFDGTQRRHLRSAPLQIEVTTGYVWMKRVIWFGSQCELDHRWSQGFLCGDGRWGRSGGEEGGGRDRTSNKYCMRIWHCVESNRQGSCGPLPSQLSFRVYYDQRCERSMLSIGRRWVLELCESNGNEILLEWRHLCHHPICCFEDRGECLDWLRKIWLKSEWFSRSLMSQTHWNDMRKDNWYFINANRWFWCDLNVEVMVHLRTTDSVTNPCQPSSPNGFWAESDHCPSSHQLSKVRVYLGLRHHNKLLNDWLIWFLSKDLCLSKKVWSNIARRMCCWPNQHHSPLS
jgi:hypothetical protein